MDIALKTENHHHRHRCALMQKSIHSPSTNSWDISPQNNSLCSTSEWDMK